MSSKGQVVLPKEVREQLRLRMGTRLAVKVRGLSILVEPQGGLTEALARLGPEIRRGLDVGRYFDEERSSWKR